MGAIQQSVNNLINTTSMAIGGAKVAGAMAKDAEVKKAQEALALEKDRVDINAQEQLAGEQLESAKAKVKEAKANLGNKERDLKAAELERDSYHGAAGEIYDELDANVSRSQKAVNTAKKELAAERQMKKQQKVEYNKLMDELKARKENYNVRASVLGIKKNLYKIDKGGKK
jgi:chromosome segregation ATPase